MHHCHLRDGEGDEDDDVSPLIILRSKLLLSLEREGVALNWLSP